MSAGRELLLGEEQQRQLAVELFNQGLFGVAKYPEEYVKLKSNRMSPHYLDIRPGISSYGTRQLVAGTMVALADRRLVARGFDYFHDLYHHFAGTPEVMTSYAASLADVAKMSLLQPRVDTRKVTGNKTPILGRFKQGDQVAEFDDVVTDGDSKVMTIKTLGAAGLTVADYFVVVDREEGGVPQVLDATGVEITPALGVSSMVIMLCAEGLLKNRQFDNVRRYFEQYGEPHAQELLAEV